jgi:hypothetical protein
MQILLSSFTFVDGKCMNSMSIKIIQASSLNIHPGRLLTSTFRPPLPCVYVGDEAFGLSTELLLSLGGKKTKCLRGTKSSATFCVEEGDL